MMDKQYFQDYYNNHRDKIKERQREYYYTKKLKIPLKHKEAYKKYKSVLKKLYLLDDETIQFFKEYYKQH